MEAKPPPPAELGAGNGNFFKALYIVAEDYFCD